MCSSAKSTGIPDSSFPCVLRPLLSLGDIPLADCFFFSIMFWIRLSVSFNVLVKNFLQTLWPASSCVQLTDHFRTGSLSNLIGSSIVID
jgi:hypothetical protein